MKDNTDLRELEKIMEDQLGIKFEVVEIAQTTMHKEYGFHLSSKVTVNPIDDNRNKDMKRFTFLISDIRDRFVDKIKAGKLFTSMVNDHKKEVESLLKDIQEGQHKIDDLLKYKHFYDLHKEIRVEGMAKYTEINKGKL